MCEWDAAPLPGQGRRKALQRRRFAISTATISVSSHAAAVSGHLFAVKAGFLRAMLPARKTGRARAKLCRRRAKISPFPLHLRKRRLFQNMQAPEGAPVAKRRLLCSAMDSGSRLFVCSSCGSGGYCAARRTAGYGSSSVLPAKAAFTARPAPTPRRRPPRWRAWPEGSCPSAHPASSRASPRPSR